MSANPVNWFEIYVQDMDRAKAFYEKVFGFEFYKIEMDMPPDCAMWGFPFDQNGPGATGALIKNPDVPSGGNSTLVYISTDNCAIAENKAAQSGGKVHVNKMSIGEHGFISIIVDTEGNMVGVHSDK